MSTCLKLWVLLLIVFFSDLLSSGHAEEQCDVQIDNKLTQLLDYHQGSVPELLQQVAEKITEISQKNNEILHAENTLRLINEKAELAQQQLMTCQNKNDDVQRQIKDVTSQGIANILNLTTDIHDKIGSSCSQCELLRAEISQIKTELSTAITINKQLVSELSTSKTTNTQLQTELSTAKTSNKQLETELSTSKTTNTQLESELSSSKTTKTQLQTELSSAETTNKQLESELSTSKATTKHMETELGTAKTTIKQLNEQIVKNTKETQLKEAERTDLLTKHANLTSQLDISNKEIQCLQFRWHGVKDESSTCLQTKQEAVTIVEKFRRDNTLAQNDTDTMGRACNNNHLSIVNAMLDLGIDIYLPVTPDQSTCLHIAAYKNDLELATLLIKRGCNINFRTEGSGWTPLMTSSWQGSLEVAKLLLDHGANLTFRASNHNNRTALGLAKYYKHTEIINLLELKGAPE